MAQLLNPFDATQFNPEQGLGQLPVGRHPVVAIASEIKTVAAGDGGFLEYELKIIDGPMTSQSGPYRLNLYNKSEKAVEIAHKQMSALCHVTGVFQVNDSSALHNIPFIIEVGFQKGQEPGSHPDAKGYTEIKKVFDINGNEPGKNNGAAKQQPQGQAQGGFNHPATQQQPAQSNPAGGFGSNVPQGQMQQQPAQQGAAWGQGQPAQQQQPQGNQQAAWGQQQPQGQQQQASAQQQGGWQQGQAQGGAAPWGAK